MRPYGGRANSIMRHAAKSDFVPVRIGPTSARQYVTGLQALNLIDPEFESSGDWHMQGSWFVSAEGVHPRAYEALLANKARFGYVLATPAELLGEDRLFDARPSLQRLGHPEGDSTEPVWAAHHDRAIVDGAWKWLHPNPSLFPGPYYGPAVANWLWTNAQFAHLHRLARKVESTLSGNRRHLWATWMRDLTPDAEWERGTYLKGTRHD